MSADDGPGNREVAFRLFAAEYDDAELSYSESDEERAPNYVVTPTGARVNRLFVVGVLTEVEPVNEEMLRARIVDPTGAFVVYAGQYQPDALAFLERTDPPAFVAVTGKARTFEPDDADRIYTSVRPESISAVDADTRDRWVVQTANQTLDRVERMADALAGEARGDALEAALRERGLAEGLAAGIPRAIAHYGTTPAYLAAVRDLALDALRVVAGEREEVDRLDVAPDDPGDVTATDLAGAPVGAEPSDAAAAGTSADASTASLTDEPPSSTERAAEPAEAAGPGSATEEPAAPESEPSPEPTDSAAAAETDAGASTESLTEEPPGETDVAAEPAEAAGPPTGATDASGSAEPADELADEPTGESTDESGSEPTGEPADEPTGESTDESGSEPTGEPADEPTGEQVAEQATGDGAPDPGASDELGDFDGEFELDEDEREHLEEEFGTEFSTGSEVEAPGEAGIEPEAPQPDAAEAADSTAGESESPEPAAGTDESTDEPAGESTDEADEPAGEPADVDLEEAALAAMRDLDEGDGADRDAVVSAVVEEYGADRDAVEETIQDALMSGQCYEPSEDSLKAI
ncbi:MAG: hypothetical protein ABEJ23_04660 [Haloarculaceae archaeon]